MPRISGKGGASFFATTAVRCIRWMAGVKRRTDGECIYAAPLVRRASQRPHNPIDIGPFGPNNGNNQSIWTDICLYALYFYIGEISLL